MIRVNQLSFSYPGAKAPTLSSLDFEIPEGEIFGFLGPSGAGKSTTQKILYKILSDFSGTVTVQEKPLQQWGKEYFERIGVGFELPNHYLKLTGAENLRLFASFYPKKKLIDIPKLFEMVDLTDSMNMPVAAYSKGMKIRLNFIRAIMHQPEILFFDEPTSGLDPVNAHKIKQHIQQLKNSGKTIFITTHDMTTADELCDRVAFLVDGQIRVMEVPSTLKNTYGQQRVRVKLASGADREFDLEKLGYNTHFLEFIQSGQVTNIHTMEATLEEVFIKVTGKELSK